QGTLYPSPNNHHRLKEPMHYVPIPTVSASSTTEEVAYAQYAYLANDLYDLALMCQDMGTRVRVWVKFRLGHSERSCYECERPSRIYDDLTSKLKEPNEDILWGSDDDEKRESKVRKLLARVVYEV
ncbi:MAG: hypothetical protein Q9174_006270, partial [Haloplaca sp. 1 TL-2023]